jgi:hypothetical protein
MAKVQKQFEQFNDTIKIKRFEEEDTLREKRDIIRRRLDDKLPGVFKAHGEECPTYHVRDQGSYKMRTGVKPINDGQFDIDQGLYFQVGTAGAYSNPVVLKERVQEALVGHTEDVSIRKPCVTVFYHSDGEPIYHVDIAVYSHRDQQDDNNDRLARGTPGSKDEDCTWEPSDQQGLVSKIETKYTEGNWDQFRRAVRALKRWKDENFRSAGHGAPRGIALTVAAYDNFSAKYSYTDPIAPKPDDLAALRSLVKSILARFQSTYDSEKQATVRRITITLPVAPKNDLCRRMTDKHMEAFEEKLKVLRDTLDAADQATDPVVACEKLQKVFGKGFPVPEKNETGKSYGPAVASSSSSA